MSTADVPAGLDLLIVEDEEAIAFAMTRYFRARGFRVETAQDPEEARSLLRTWHFDVVIADLRLRGVHDTEGLELLSAARASMPAVRTVLLTAYGSPAVTAEAHARGVDLVLQKPQPLHDLALRLSRLLRAPAQCPER